jgi:putative membrane protein
MAAGPQGAATSDDDGFNPAASGAALTKERTMLGVEWMKPGLFVGSLLFALLGVLVFWICFVIIDKLTPYELWKEIVEKQNVALAIVVGAMCIAIGLIVSASVHG